MKRIGIVTFLALRLVAQNPVVRQGSSPSGDVDFSNANTTKPVRTGGTLPSACTANELFFLTNVGLHQCVRGKFAAVGNGGTWGTVGGAIAAQTDLWNALQNKQPLLKGTQSQFVRGDGSLGALAPSATTDTTDASRISSGTLPPERLPNPTTTTIGGLYAAPATAHQWLSNVDANGQQHFSQPDAGDLTAATPGGVQRTQAAKNADMLSVKDFGAASDGITDDTAALQAAHNAACAASGGDLMYPAGTYLISTIAGASAGTFKICANMHITLAGGATVRVKPNAGDYWALYQPSPVGIAVDNFTLDGPGTIDQNVYNNTTSNISVASATTTAQAVVAIWNGSNIQIKGVRVFASGINTFSVNGTGVGVVKILNNHITFQKRLAQAGFDNSALYVHGKVFQIANNTLDSTLADMAGSAIEMHAGTGNVTGNSSSLYSAGAQIVDTQNAVVQGNTFSGCNSGVNLWSLATTGPQTGTNVSGNVVSINNVDRQSPAVAGIATYYGGGITGSFSNLTISGNTITHQYEPSPRTVASTSNVGIGLINIGNVTNASITDNLIVNAPIEGIRIGSSQAGTTYSNITVTGNTIIDAGTNTESSAHNYSAAIWSVGNLTDVTIARNNIRFTSNPFIGNNSIYLAGTGFTLTRFYVYDNPVTLVNGSAANYYDSQVGLSSPLAIAQVLGAWCNGVITSNSTVNLMGDLGYAAGSSCNSTSVNTSGIPLRAGTIKNLRVRVSAISNTAGSGVVTVYKNNFVQPLTCTLSTSGTCSDLVHSFSVSEGDSVSIRVQSTAPSGDTPANIFASVQLF